MTTMGLRGVLAGALIVSTGLLTGMAAVPSGAEASEPGQALVGVPGTEGAGLLDRVRLKACQISLAATRRDRSASRDRSRECEQ